MERVKSMSEYHIGQIFSWDRRTLRDMDGLLEKEGIERDRNLDYSAGLLKIRCGAWRWIRPIRARA